MTTIRMQAATGVVRTVQPVYHSTQDPPRSEHPDILNDVELRAVKAAMSGLAWSWLGAPGPQIAAERTGIDRDRIQAYIDRCLVVRSRWPELLSDDDCTIIANYRRAAGAARLGSPGATPPPDLSEEQWIERDAGIPAEAILAYALATNVGLSHALRATGHRTVDELLDCVRGQRRHRSHPQRG